MPDSNALQSDVDVKDFMAMAAMARVVSFDFFDTLVLRPVAEPAHVFLAVEKAVALRVGRARSFAPQRRQAEAIARTRAWREQARVEVTLDDIYAVLPEFGFDVALCRIYRDEEIAAERRLCKPDLSNKKFYDHAVTAGKKIIIVSDIYLPQGVLKDIAERCGYGGNPMFFVSSVCGESKGTEGLWPIILDRMRAEKWIDGPQDILHVGDNAYSDVKVPSRWGIRVLHKPCLAERYRHAGLEGLPLLNAVPDSECPLARSLLTGVFRQGWLELGAKDKDQLDLRDLGFFVIGPLLLGFALWLRQRSRADRIQKMVFLAREGQIFKQAFEKVMASFGESIETHYIYTSRRATYFPAIDHLDGPANTFMVVASPENPIPLREYFTRLGISIEPYAEELISMFGSLEAPMKDWYLRLGYYFRSRVYPKLDELMASERELLTNYLHDMGVFGGRVGLCDVGYNGGMQYGIERMARFAGQDTTFRGYYFGTFDKATYGGGKMTLTGWLFDSRRPRARWESFMQSMDIMELFFTSGHGTALGYERKNGTVEPVLRAITEEETERAAFVKEAQAGALRFVEIFLDAADGFVEGLSPDTCLSPWRTFITDPPRAWVSFFAKLTHNWGAGVSSYVDFINPTPLWKEILKRPSTLMSAAHRSLWRQGFRASLPPLKRRVFDYLVSSRG